MEMEAFQNHIAVFECENLTNFENFVNFGASLRCKTSRMRNKLTFFENCKPLAIKNILQNAICVIMVTLTPN